MRFLAPSTSNTRVWVKNDWNLNSALLPNGIAYRSMQQCGKSGSVVQCFGAVFDEHTARIKRIVKEEFSGCSAIIDQDAWPMIRFRIQDAQGTILAAMQQVGVCRAMFRGSIR